MLKFFMRKFLKSRGFDIAEMEKTVLAATQEAQRMDGLMEEFEAMVRSKVSEGEKKHAQETAKREQDRRERQAARQAELAKKREMKDRARPRPPEVIPPNSLAPVRFREGQLDPVFAAGEDAAAMSKQEADRALRVYAEARAEGDANGLILDVVNWLINDSTCDDRHGMLGFNWDHGFAIPAWVIRQPEVDIATVLRAFDLAQPQYYMAALARGEDIQPYDRKGFDFVVEAGRRIANANYKTPANHHAIGYKPSRVTWDRTSPNTMAAEKLIFPQSAFTTLPGRNPESIAADVPYAWAEVLN